MKRPDLQRIIRIIAEICVFNVITPWWEYKEGEKNIVADKLSRFKKQPFSSLTFSVNNCKDISARDSIINIINKCA